MKEKTSMVNHPEHYNLHPKGIECIDVVEDMNFNLGNAIKYMWRQGLKKSEGKSAQEKQIEDLRKSIWYIEREIERISK